MIARDEEKQSRTDSHENRWSITKTEKDGENEKRKTWRKITAHLIYTTYRYGRTRKNQNRRKRAVTKQGKNHSTERGKRGGWRMEGGKGEIRRRGGRGK